MLYITDTAGNKVKSISLVFRETAGQAGALVTVQAQVFETDTALTGRNLTATLNWNDGSGKAVSLGQVSLDQLGTPSWTVAASRRLMPGSYIIVLKAQNYRAPVEDVATLNFLVTVVPAKPPYNPQHLIFGPLLPRDSGFPNPDQWEFQIDSDLLVLESSVKMLLLTAKGDRVMEPSYGTNIRKMLFEANNQSTESLIREEIISAFALWEPRVELSDMTVQRDPNARTMTLDLTLVSKLNKQPFETSIEFVR